MNVHVKTAKYIVIDGVDGSGKGTVMKHLMDTFPNPYNKNKSNEDIRREGVVGKYTIFTREPGGTPLGEKLRSLILNDSMTSYTEFCLFVGQRAEVRKMVIEPALQSGVNVISDRSDSATFAYQLRGRQLTHLEDFYWSTRNQVLPLPTLYVFLDVDPRVSAKRLSGLGKEADNFERENLQFFERVSAGYKEFAQKVETPCRFVDAGCTPEEVAEEVTTIVNEHFGNIIKLSADIVVPLSRRV